MPETRNKNVPSSLESDVSSVSRLPLTTLSTTVTAPCGIAAIAVALGFSYVRRQRALLVRGWCSAGFVVACW